MNLEENYFPYRNSISKCFFYEQAVEMNPEDIQKPVSVVRLIPPSSYIESNL